MDNLGGINLGNLNLGNFNLNNIIIESNKNNAKNIALLSLYFNKCPYLLNYLSFQEVKEIFKTTENIDINEQFKLFLNIENLCEKIKNNECIIEEEALREIQISTIQLFTNSLKSENFDINNFINYFQIINFFRDVDFCLKILALHYFSIINDKNIILLMK